MKAYVKSKPRQVFRYQEDLTKIINYLNNHGKLFIQEDTVEVFYYKFCDEKFSAGWMTPDEDTLEYFADWLADLDF